MPALRCDHCRTLLPGAVVNTPAPVACPGCHTALSVRVFPAFLQPTAAGRPAEALASEEDAGCFYHPRKKAVVPCERCGRFLCALCDLDTPAGHLCPACMEGARATGRSLRAGNRRTLHDKLALVLALLGAPGLPFTGELYGHVNIFSVAGYLAAPVALYLAIRYWNEPARSPVPRTRAWTVLAALLAGGQIVWWMTRLVLYLTHAHRG